MGAAVARRHRLALGAAAAAAAASLRVGTSATSRGHGYVRSGFLPSTVETVGGVSAWATGLYSPPLVTLPVTYHGFLVSPPNSLIHGGHSRLANTVCEREAAGRWGKQGWRWRR